MERPYISSALETKMVALQAENQRKVYVHKELLDGEVASVRGCTWSCFPSTTVKSFVEYLYQGDYTCPSAVYTGADTSEFDSDSSTDDEIFLSSASFTPLSSHLYSTGHEEVFLRHAQLFILSRHRNVPSLTSLSLKKLGEAMAQAMAEVQGTAEESETLFVKNMCALIEYSYDPCCHNSENGGIWKELQKAVCGFLVSQKGWLLEMPGFRLISEEEQLTKDLLTAFINLSIDTDKLRMEAERKCEALKTEIAQSKSAKKKRQALTIWISVKEYEEINAYHI